MPEILNEDYLLQALVEAKQQGLNRVITQLNGLTYRALNTYPQAEVESWPIQKIEAERFLAAGNEASIEMAPLIARVCFYHHGPSDEDSHLLQIKAKSDRVISNSTAFLEAASFVNGTRARREEEINAQTTVEDVFRIVRDAMMEIETFRVVSQI